MIGIESLQLPQVRDASGELGSMSQSPLEPVRSGVWAIRPSPRQRPVPLIARGLLSSLEALPDLGTKEVAVLRAPEMAGMQAGK